jgi:nucleotide-binding universal stress UspA family protein
MKRHTPATIHARVLLGDASTEISRVVESIGADLLVVGVPTRGRVAKALFGSTAARLLRASRVPVLAVPEVTTVSGGQETAPLQLAA